MSTLNSNRQLEVYQEGFWAGYYGKYTNPYSPKTEQGKLWERGLIVGKDFKIEYDKDGGLSLER